MNASEAELDPSVCYRHPDRTSWVLCTRCGKTICPECQILTPSGVQCPDCVRETGGSVRWEPAQVRPPKRLTAQRRARAQGAERERPRWRQVVGEMLRPGGAAPALTWGVAAITAVLWIVGLIAANAPLLYLAAWPDFSVQIWRYFTSAFVYPAGLNVFVVLGVIVNILFFLLIGPGTERMLGRPRFALVFLAATAAGSAVMVLAGGIGYGLIGPLWGLLGAYLVAVWEHPAVRAQLLIVLAFNAVFSLVLGAQSLPELLGGFLAGIGVNLLLRRWDDRPHANPRTPYLITSAGVAMLIVFAILRNIF